MKASVLEEVKKLFRPEFINRIDELVVFHPLATDHIKEIAKVMITRLTKRLQENIGVDIQFTEEAMNFLVEKGYDQAYGARPLRRTIQTHIEDKLSDALLDASVEEGSKIQVDVKEGSIVFVNE
jgi:ATP-dependent Clp protease ATP-binding subunit ClpC